MQMEHVVERRWRKGRRSGATEGPTPSNNPSIAFGPDRAALTLSPPSTSGTQVTRVQLVFECTGELKGLPMPKGEAQRRIAFHFCDIFGLNPAIVDADRLGTSVLIPMPQTPPHLYSDSIIINTTANFDLLVDITLMESDTIHGVTSADPLQEIMRTASEVFVHRNQQMTTT